MKIIDCEEACAQGAAILAGVGVGTYFSFSDATKKTCKINKYYSPNKETKSVYDKNYNIYKILYQNTKNLMKEI